jgi:NDP-sugar pyrophosphorylase family protein
MLLAAGRGERMEPLSSWIAKPALDVLGEPLLATPLRLLARTGCARVVVNLHRHPDRVAAAARDAVPAGTDLAFSWEPELLGGAGGIAAARPLLGAGAVLAANADVWAACDLSALARGGEDEIVLALLPHPDTSRWSAVTLDAGGRVTAILPPRAQAGGDRFLFTGFQRIGSKVVAALPAPPAEMAPVWDELGRRGALRGVLVSGSWWEAGSPAAYRELVIAALGEASWTHVSAAVEPSAVLRTTAVGAGCRVGGGAHLTACVLTAGAAIDEAARLSRCVVAGPVTVPPGTTLTDTLVLPGRMDPLLRG